jgi:thiol:disulfide interchange protein
MKVFLAVALLMAIPYTPANRYDPGRNADQDIKDAVAEAQKTGKRILLEVGGDWCQWCHIMDDYFDKNPKLAASRDSNFIMVKINFSPQNENEKTLAKYPKILGYPHLFVLDTNGTLLHSQFTGDLEQGESYNLQKFTEFLNKWAPSSRSRD